MKKEFFMYYTLHERLRKINNTTSGAPACIETVLTLSPTQWDEQKTSLRFPSYAGLENTIIRSCKAEIYPRYISGSLCIPNRKHLLETPFCFTFYMNEACIVFVSDDSVPDHH